MGHGVSSAFEPGMHLGSGQCQGHCQREVGGQIGLCDKVRVSFGTVFRLSVQPSLGFGSDQCLRHS